MKKFLKRVLAPVVVGAMLVGVAAPAVAADETVAPGSNATASSLGWQVDRGSFGLDVSLPPDSLLGGALGWILNPIISKVLYPVQSALNGIPAALVNPLLTAVAGDAVAGSPTNSDNPSGEPFALSAESSLSCAGPSDTCYSSPLAVPLDLGVVKLKLGTLHGLTEAVQTDTGYDFVSQAQVANLELGLLGIELLSLDALSSSVTCTVVGDAAPRASASTASLSLINDIIRVGVAESTGALDVSIAGNSIVGVGAIDLTAIEGYLGPLVDVSLDEHLLRIGVGLSAEELLRNLGLSSLWDLLNALALRSVDAKLVLVISNALEADETFASASGLHVGIGLYTNIEVNLLRLVGARIATSGSVADASNNLISLDLARTSCASTSTPGASDEWIEPGLT